MGGEKKNWKEYILVEKRISTMLVAREYRSKGKFAIKGQRSQTRFNSIPHDPSCQFRGLHVKRATKRSTIYEPSRAEQRFHNTVPCYHVSKILFCPRDDAFESSDAPDGETSRQKEQCDFYHFMEYVL